MLEQVQYRDPRWSGRWPEARDERLGHHASRRRARGRRASGASPSEAPTHLVGLLADTEHLTVTTGRVYAGHVEDPRKVEDESLLVVTAGELWVDVQEQDGDGYATDCLLAGDAMYVPAHSTMRVLSRSRPAVDLPHGVGPPGRSGLGSLVLRSSGRAPSRPAPTRPACAPATAASTAGGSGRWSRPGQQLDDQAAAAGCPTYRARRRAR